MEKPARFDRHDGGRRRPIREMVPVSICQKVLSVLWPRAYDHGEKSVKGGSRYGVFTVRHDEEGRRIDVTAPLTVVSRRQYRLPKRFCSRVSTVRDGYRSVRGGPTDDRRTTGHGIVACVGRSPDGGCGPASASIVPISARTAQAPIS
jgi:hypothetical protein